MTELVSIVVPTYNSERTISTCVSSVFAQEYKHWELHIVDNSSSDSTLKLLEPFSTDPRVYIHSIDNGGSIAKSRNLGISFSRGVWIAFLDSDDFWHPHKLLRCMTASDISDFIYHSVSYISDSLRILPLPRQYSIDTSPLLSLLLRGNPIVTSSVIVRHSTLVQIGLFDTSLALATAEDYSLWLSLAHGDSRFHFLPDKLAYYRYSTSSASRRKVSIPISLAQRPYLHVLSPTDVLRARCLPAYFLYRYQRPATKRRLKVCFCLLIRYGTFSLKARTLLLSTIYSLSPL